MPTRHFPSENVVRQLHLAATRNTAPLIVAIALAACSSSGNSTTQPPPTPSIDITVSPTAVSVSQGQSGTTTATINRTNFTGDIALTAEGLPTGVTASFNPTSLTNGATSSVVTFSAANTAPPTNLIPLSARFVRPTRTSAAVTSASSSSASVTIRATGSGVTDKTASLALTVLVAGGYTLSASAASLSIQQGGSGSSTINVARSGGFAGSVALGVTGMPTGMTATLNPTSTTGDSASLSVAAASTTAPGSYTLTVTGTSAGLSNQSTTVSVTVTALTSSSIQYCPSDTPIWFGYQNDGASWVRVAVGANNSFTFSATPKVAIAAVTQTGSGQSASYDLTVVYTTPTEIAALAGAICAQQGGSKQLNGSVAGLATTEAAQIGMGNSSALALSTPGTFTLSNLPDGALDLVAAKFPFGDPNTLAANSLIVRRAVNLTTGSTIPVLDFSAGEAFAPATTTLSLSGVGSDVASAVVQFITGSGTASMLTALNNVGPSSTISGVPSAQLGTGDIHQLIVSASPSGSSDARGVIKYLRNISAASADVKPALNTPTITVPSATPYAQPSAQVASQSDYASGVGTSYTQSSANRSASVLVTSGYLGGAPATWTVTLPDLSAAPSFDVNWGPKANTATDWEVQAFGGPLGAILAAGPTDGATLNFASRNGTLTTPAASRRTPVVVSANRSQPVASSLPRAWLRGARMGTPIQQ